MHRFLTCAALLTCLSGCDEDPLEAGTRAPSSDAPTPTPIAETDLALDSDITFGTSCQEVFQKTESGTPWIDTIDKAMSDCSDWITVMDDVATSKWFYSLKNAKPYYEEASDQASAGGLESVDIHFGHSHGGSGGTKAWFTVFEVSTRAYSNAMRLGDEGRKLSIMLNHACDQGRLDGLTWDRWLPIFQGGLRLAGAAHGSFYYNSKGDHGFGKYVAQYLKSGERITNSWGWGATKADSKNQPIAIATGKNSDGSDCATRRDMTLQTFKDKSRLGNFPRASGPINYMCWNYWN